MADILDVITTRKSIRRYKPDPVPEEMINKILEAARWALPVRTINLGDLLSSVILKQKNKIGRLARIGSGSRMTAWYCLGDMQERFTKIEDPVRRAEVLRFMYSGEVSEFAKNAPLIIAVIGTLMEGSIDVPYDLSAAIENMLLEAHSIGLGACWVHGPVATTRDAKKFKEILDIPTGMGEYKVIAYVAFGWPAEERKHPRPKKSLDELVYWRNSEGRKGLIMNKMQYCNDLMVRMEELFYHELSDCAPFKVELVGVDFIQSREIKGDSTEGIIQSCIREIKEAGLVKEIEYNISGMRIKLELRMKDCVHLPKEARLRRSGVKPYICPIANMILDQLIEKLGYETTYIARMDIDEETGECKVCSAIYENEEQIGKVCNWHEG